MITRLLSHNLLPFDGHAVLCPDFLTPEEQGYYMETLQRQIAWRQDAILMFGRSVMQPRLTAWYGDAGKVYRYSGMTMQPLPWIPARAMIKEHIERETGNRFNSALLNLYRDGNDSMGWHRDNERELGKEPVIASLSLGKPRLFQFRHYKDRKMILSLPLEAGSLLIMSGVTQTHWQHRLPKIKNAEGIRINITFRRIIA